MKIDKRKYGHKYDHIGVMYNDEYKNIFPKTKPENLERFGQVVNESGDKKSWWVIWDGTKSKDCVSKIFTHAVDTETGLVI